MKKTIILFQPKFWPGPLNNEKPPAKQYYHGMRETFNYLPLGLLAIGSALKDKYAVRIIDERFDEDWSEIVRTIINSDDVLFAGVTACSGFDISGGISFSKLLRQEAPYIPIVWGGWHASTVPEETVKSDLVDIVVRGQGEWTVRELAERLEAGSHYEGIKGLTYITQEGDIVNEPDRDIRPATDLFETDYSLVDVKRYLRYQDGTPARLFYISSIGCPYDCAFCSIASVYKQHRSSKDPETVVREIRYFVDNYGINTVEFDGTNFFASRTWSKKLLKALIDNNLRLNYVTATRADLIMKWDDEMKELVKTAGFKSIGIGGESGSDRILKRIDKRIKVNDIIESLKVLKDLDVDPAYTFMFGLPGETTEDALMTLRLMARLKKIMPGCRTPGLFYHPFPGSKTYQEYRQMQKFRVMTLEEWADYSFDLTHTKSLALTDEYVEFIQSRLKYLYWAYPEDNGTSRITRKLFSRLARLRVNNEFYALPIEWRLAKAFGKKVSLEEEAVT